MVSIPHITNVCSSVWEVRLGFFFVSHYKSRTETSFTDLAIFSMVSIPHITIVSSSVWEVTLGFFFFHIIKVELRLLLQI